jgi:hypothetical protein
MGLMVDEPNTRRVESARDLQVKKKQAWGSCTTKATADRERVAGEVEEIQVKQVSRLKGKDNNKDGVVAGNDVVNDNAEIKWTPKTPPTRCPPDVHKGIREM